MTATEDVSANVPLPKRVFLSGIASTLTENELCARLQTYGAILSPLEINDKNATTMGVFAHCDLLLDDASWSRLRKLSGTVLKGSKLRIEEAKQSWNISREQDQARPDPQVPNSRKRPPTGTIPAVVSKRVKRNEVIRDSEITQRSRSKGWIKGRYGRALAILRRDGEAPLKRNPDALSRLWGSAHPDKVRLTGWYDDEEEEWYDRGGRVIKEIEISRKLKPVEIGPHGRVEVWDSDVEDMDAGLTTESMIYTVASSAKPDYVPFDAADEHEIPDEVELDLQLAEERAKELSLIGDMFKETEAAEVAAEVTNKRNKSRDQLNIIKRFDPNAPESDSGSMSVSDQNPGDQNIAVNSVEPVISKDVDQTASEDQPQNAREEPLRQETDTVSGKSLDEPRLLQSLGDHVATLDLATIFKPSLATEEKPFTLFHHSDVESEGDFAEETHHADFAGVDMHPDRLNRTETFDDTLETADSNPNFTALAKDRGFGSLSGPVDNGVFPLMLSQGPGSLWAQGLSFFGDEIDIELVKQRWEASRADVTRDWKKKRREGTRRQRKAINRQVR